jgi:DNA ligase (NAD+)
LEGWGRQSVENLRYAINEKKNISLEKFIYSLGIRHIGLENAKLISRNIKSSINFINLNKNNKLKELEDLDGIGETQIKSIKKFFLNKINQKIISSLQQALTITDAKDLTMIGKLKNQTFMITGKLLNMSRSEAKTLIEQNAGSIVSNVSNKLDYLILGSKPTKRKVEAAKELNIKILNQSDWLDKLNKTS